MSPMMDANTAIHDDEVAAKKMVGVLGTFRKSIRMAAEKSPLLPGQRGLKVSESGSGCSKAPPSPSVTSPLETVVALSQAKDDNEAGEKGGAMIRSKTEPNMAPLDSLLKKGASIRRSLKFASWKNKKQEAFLAVQDGTSKGEMEEEVEEKDLDKVWEEMEETYTLPELPHTPLSVMQINKLIEMEVLEEAHLNLLALRVEFQQEWQRCGQDSSMELAKKEKDLSLLYAHLRHKIMSIVRTSISLPSRNKGLLVHVARIIQEEDKRAQEPGGLQGSWMDAWGEAVGEGVRQKVESIYLEQSHLNTSWLSVHLGLLGKAVVEDLDMVKRDIRWSYPPSFMVFSTYVESYHSTIKQHLKKLLQQATQLKDLYSLLDWIVHQYHSERIMESATLQPDMKDKNLQLDEDFLLQLREKFCTTVKEDMKAFLDRVIELENEEMWTARRHPDKEEAFFNSDFHMDIWTKVKGNVVNAGHIDAELEHEVIRSCLQELRNFPKRFDAAFQQYCSALRPQPLWSEYNVSYINSFAALLHHMETYGHQCADLVKTLKKEVRWLLYKFLQSLEDQFKEEIKPYLRRMMTRKWLTNNDDFNQLYARTELISQHSDAMRPPHGQALASQVHCHVMKEYVGQLMKNNYSCKNRKHEKAAAKIRAQCTKLRELFQDMRSSEDWLYPVGDHLSDIIGQKNKADIKNHLQSLLEQYPDFSSTHLLAVLTFRGLPRGREHQQIMLRLKQLKKTAAIAAALQDCDNKRRWFFRNMEVAVRTDCLSDIAFVCLTFIHHGR